MRFRRGKELFRILRIMASFEKTYKEFIADLLLTFPEHKDALSAAAAAPVSAERFVVIWRPNVSAVAKKDASIFNEEIEMVQGFSMTRSLWNELSSTSQDAIWKYLSTLLLLSAQETPAGFFDLSGFALDMEKMMEMLKGDGSQFSDLFEKLGKMAESFGFKDLSGAADKFKIPERMFRGHIARIAQELVSEIKPEDFGLDPEMMNNKDPKAVFEFLSEIFTKKPDMLMSIAQKIANKIRAKFMRGEIRREDIVAEAEELMKEFSENEAFTELFGSLRDAMVGAEKASGNEGSARRREAQERLRKKAAEKAAKKASEPQTNIIVNRAEAQAHAAAMAALLIAEEGESPKKKGGKRK